jgi:hypothetical protein
MASKSNNNGGENEIMASIMTIISAKSEMAIMA